MSINVLTCHLVYDSQVVSPFFKSDPDFSDSSYKYINMCTYKPTFISCVYIRCDIPGYR